MMEKIERIIRTVARAYDVDVRDILGTDRHRAVSEPRQLSVYICRHKCPEVTLEELSAVYGRSYPTLISGMRSAGYRLELYKETREKYNLIMKRLNDDI